MIKYAPAKINLSLEIIKKRNDGYHELCTIFQAISLYDILDIEKHDEIILTVNNPNIPTDERNLVVKASKLFFEYTKINGGCKIDLKKHIPDGAGLGGGSSDAAETIIALNEIYNAGLSEDELKKLAVKLGADVPFFITKGTCLAEGIGEKLTKIDNNSDPDVLIIKPDFSISTKWAYENFDFSLKQNHSIDDVVSSLKEGDKNLFCKSLFNDLEVVSSVKYKEIENLKSMLKNHGADASLMSGSGSSVFGIFFDKQKTKEAYESLKNYNTFLANFI